MKKVAFTLACVLFAINITAQDLDGYRLSGGAYISPKEYVLYLKLPFFKETFLKGKITTAKGRVVTPIDLRFDMFTNELQYLYNKRVYLVSEPVSEFILFEPIGDSIVEYKFRKYQLENHGKVEPVFCEVLYDGSIKLLKYVKKSEMNVSEMTQATTKKTFIDYEVLYLQQEDKPLLKLDKNVKNLLSLIPFNKQQQVEDYIKLNKIKINNKEQLTNVLIFYDSLNPKF
ncbi:hypothetical protein NF867_09790 [Solitalea sp. MAHUQ-68]|uniref:Uncharacterized protein n=1 Tax=Solitalea agri TaxID=2953739 RepID=A0A9X2JDQ3_9SPHI|nr:hypothetical protein [Solitalea agri]MCO4293155.1 hypothetical protein [Solitalea agri]